MMMPGLWDWKSLKFQSPCVFHGCMWVLLDGSRDSCGISGMCTLTSLVLGQACLCVFLLWWLWWTRHISLIKGGGERRRANEEAGVQRQILTAGIPLLSWTRKERFRGRPLERFEKAQGILKPTARKLSVLLSTTNSVRIIWGFQIPFSLRLGSQDLVRDAILGTLHVSKLGC